MLCFSKQHNITLQAKGNWGIRHEYCKGRAWRVNAVIAIGKTVIAIGKREGPEQVESFSLGLDWLGLGLGLLVRNCDRCLGLIFGSSKLSVNNVVAATGCEAAAVITTVVAAGVAVIAAAMAAIAIVATLTVITTATALMRSLL